MWENGSSQVRGENMIGYFAAHITQKFGAQSEKKVCPISPLSSPHKKSLQHKTFPISRKKNPEKGASHPTRPDLGVGKGQTKMQCYSFSFVGGKCSVILFQRLLLL